ncbi:MAG: hypothetical protein AB7I59_25240 [Geminicoccaceae bacterium]
MLVSRETADRAPVRTRRGLIADGMAVGLGLALPGAALAPAAAAAGWGTGPRSGLPFWLGAHSQPDAVVALMPAGRGLDVVNDFENARPYYDVVASTIAGWRKRSFHRHLVEGRAAAMQWASSPFCSGAGFQPPAAWPSSRAAVTAATWLNASRPPTFTGSENMIQQRSKQRRVWQIAADGWLEPVWREKMIAFKRDYFIRYRLTAIRIILRVAHEINLAPKWGNTDYMRSYAVRLLDPASDGPIVQEGLRRYIEIFRDVFGNVQSSIPGDYAYRDDQLWPYWCPLKDHGGDFDSRVTCPGNAKLVGPDYYDHWPASMTPAEWSANILRRSKQGWPIGLAVWRDWAKAKGRLLAVGEWGLMSMKTTETGGRPSHEGWDNPTFVTQFLEFCRANAADMAFACYFNKDVVASASLPGHLIGPWDGLDDSGVTCERAPPGDLNRCGSRAFAQWMADRS